MLQKIRTRFGKVNVYAAGNPDGERVLVIPGYSETITHNRHLVDELGKKGLFAATISQPRKWFSGRKRDPIDRQADVLIAMLDRLGDNTKISAVGHSLGAVAVMKAAQARPYRFERIILEQPAGFGSQQQKPEQIKHVIGKETRNKRRASQGQGVQAGSHLALPDVETGEQYSKRVGRARTAAAGFIARNLGLAIRESTAAGKYNGQSDYDAVRSLGIPIHIVGAHSDELFDSNELDGRFISEDGDVKGSLSYPIDREAGHDTLWMQPKLHAEIISSAMSDSWTPKIMPAAAQTTTKL